MLPAFSPSSDHKCDANRAVDVLPFVPVTPAISSGWRGKNLAAICAKRRRGSLSTINGRDDFTPGLASTAAAPLFSASAINFAPSAFTPASAANKKPRDTVRLSAVSPSICGSGEMVSYASSESLTARPLLAARKALLLVATLVARRKQMTRAPLFR